MININPLRSRKANTSDQSIANARHTSYKKKQLTPATSKKTLRIRFRIQSTNQYAN